MKRITVTIPDKLQDDLDFLSEKLSVSRSALISELLSDSVGTMREIFSAAPASAGDASPEQLRRLRGKSADAVKTAVAEAQSALSDLEGFTLEG